MPDSLTRLKRADALVYLDARDDAPARADVLERIVANAPPAQRRRGRLAPAAVAVAAVGIAVLAAWLWSGGKVDLATRAYGATAPENYVIFTVTTTEMSNDAARMQQRTRLTMWQRGDRMHNVEEVAQAGGTPANGVKSTTRRTACSGRC